MNTANSAPLIRSTVWRWTVMFTCLVAIIIYRTIGNASLFLALGNQPRFVYIISEEGLFWISLGVFMPLALLLMRKIPVRRDSLFSSLAVHLAIALAITLCHALIVFYLAPVVLPAGSPFLKGVIQIRESGLLFLLPFMLNSLPPYVFALAIYAVLLFMREQHQRSMSEERLLSALHRARHLALRNTVQPHFLFNTLHAISSRARRSSSPEVAEMIVQLGQLLRRATELSTREMVPLREELALCRDVLSIARLRFGERLSWDIQVDERTAELPVPAFTLQPLVENALRHGLETTSRAVSVSIVAGQRENHLHLTVRDTGTGIAHDFTLEEHGGVGLRTLAERLALTYGEQVTLRFHQPSEGGTEVRLLLPGYETGEQRP